MLSDRAERSGSDRQLAGQPFDELAVHGEFEQEIVRVGANS
jgi:hypothetical protein